MIARPLPNRRFVQNAWVVPDLDAAMAAWVKSTGVGPFFTVDPPQQDGALYRGKPCRTPNIRAALAQAGDMQIELVSPLDDGMSIFRDLVPAGKSGFHHAAICTENYDEDVAFYTNAGAEVAFSMISHGNRICWIDTSPQLGFMVEIMAAGSAVQAIFDIVRGAAEGWDGKDPVRDLVREFA